MKLIIKKDNSKYKLKLDKLTIFKHSSSMPFIIVIKGDLKYKAKRGNFSVTENITDRIKLKDLKIKEKENSIILTFSKDDISVTLTCTEENGVVDIKLSSKGDFDAISFFFNAASDEAIFGLGERFRRLNHKGHILDNLVSEHITLMPIIKKSLPPFKWIKYKPAPKVKTYSPMTTYMSSRYYAIKVDTAAYGKQDFSQKCNVLTYWELPKSIKFIYNQDFKSISKKMASANPNLPDWANDGMIIATQGGIDYAVDQSFKMLDSGAKINGVWCQDWSGEKITIAGKQVYWNWIVSNELYPNLKEKITELNSRGVRFLAYINPYLIQDSPMYNEFKDKGYLINTNESNPYLFKTTTFPAGMMDLTNPECYKYIKDVIIKKNMLELGISGWMADFGEYLPAGLILHNGEKSEDSHNIWPTLWAKCNREAIQEANMEQEAFFFTRSGYNGAEKYACIMWNGDQHTDYSVDYGMACTIPANISLGISGLPLSHSDIGGYITFKGLKRDSELYIKWMSMNTFSPLMRTHETTRPAENAQYDDEKVLIYTSYYSNIHAMLKPYINIVIKQAKQGIPAMRTPLYNFNDPCLYDEDYAYMFGDDLFVAPVIIEGSFNRTLMLPEEEWVHLFTGEKYKGGKLIVEAQLNCPPVFYLANSKNAKLFEEITNYARNFKF